MAVAIGPDSRAIANSIGQLSAVAIAQGRDSTAEAQGEEAFGFANDFHSEAHSFWGGYVDAVWYAKANNKIIPFASEQFSRESFLNKLKAPGAFTPGPDFGKEAIVSICKEILAGSTREKFN